MDSKHSLGSLSESEDKEIKTIISGDDQDKLKKLQEENKSLIPKDLLNAKDFQKQIEDEKDIKKQELFKTYLKQIELYPLREDLFKRSIGSPDSCVMNFLKNPDNITIQTTGELMKRQDSRIKYCEKITGKRFEGKSTDDLIKIIGSWYEDRIITRTSTPSKKNIFENIGEPGKSHIKWSKTETETNLKWKKQLNLYNANPLAFVDWLQKNLDETEKTRDKQIIACAEKNLKTAENYPQYFSKKYIEQIKNIRDYLRSGKPNYFPIELLNNFEENFLKIQKDKRLTLEKDIYAELDKNSKLISQKKVMDWKTGWVKNAPIEELIDWFKPQGAKRKFDEEIESLGNQKNEFIKKLDAYKGKDEKKQEYIDWYENLDPNDKKQEFNKLIEKYEYGKEKKSNENVLKLKTDKKDYLLEKENEKLDEIEKLPISKQEEVIKEISRNIEKREHIYTRATVRKQNFDKEIKDYDEGKSLKEIDEILKPIIDINKGIEDEKCPATINLIHEYEQIRNKYEKPLENKKEKIINEEDFISKFLEDHKVSTILLAETMNLKRDLDEKKSPNDNIADQINKAEKADKESAESKLYKQTLDEHIGENVSKSAPNNMTEHDINEKVEKIETNISLSTPYMKNSIHEDTSFQKKYEELQEENQKKILESDQDLNKQVKDTKSKSNFVIDLDQYLHGKQISKETSEKVSKTILSGDGNVNITDSSKRDLAIEDHGKKTKLKGVFSTFTSKLFGKEKEAEKIDSSDMFTKLKEARQEISRGDTDKTAKRKLARKLMKFV